MKPKRDNRNTSNSHSHSDSDSISHSDSGHGHGHGNGNGNRVNDFDDNIRSPSPSSLPSPLLSSSSPSPSPSPLPSSSPILALSESKARSVTASLGTLSVTIFDNYVTLENIESLLSLSTSDADIDFEKLRSADDKESASEMLKLIIFIEELTVKYSTIKAYIERLKNNNNILERHLTTIKEFLQTL
ncbi:MAG: hypothetical protein QXF17_02710 [Ignisphaera sp.]